MQINNSDCLVVVDVQNGFMNKNTAVVCDEIINLSHRQNFTYIVATKFENFSDSPWCTLMHWNKLMDDHEKIIVPQIESIATRTMAKSRYSCITDELLSYAAVNKIQRLFLCGVDTEGCVLISAVDAFEHGIDCYVLSNCCRSSSGNIIHQAGLEVIKKLIGVNRVIEM